jgi:hypothetical protein
VKTLTRHFLEQLYVSWTQAGWGFPGTRTSNCSIRAPRSGLFEFSHSLSPKSGPKRYCRNVPQADLPYPGVCELVAHMAQLSRAPHMPSSAAIVSKNAVVSVNSAPLMEYPLEYGVVPVPLW